jgi:hypothetical protein
MTKRKRVTSLPMRSWLTFQPARTAAPHCFDVSDLHIVLYYFCPFLQVTNTSHGATLNLGVCVKNMDLAKCAPAAATSRGPRRAIAHFFPLSPLHHLRPQPRHLCAFLIDTPAIRISLNSFDCTAGARSNRHSLRPSLDVNSMGIGRSFADRLFVSRAHGKRSADNSCYNSRWSWPATHVTLRKPIEPTLDPRVPSSSCPCARPRRILGWGKPKSRRMAPDLTRGVQGLAAHGEVDRSSKFSSRRAPLANCVIP